MRKKYEQDKFFAIYSSISVIVIFSILSILTYIIGETPSPLTCYFSVFFLSISRFLGALASAYSCAFLTGYLDAIDIIYIGRGDKIYLQSLVGFVSFLIAFFWIFGRFSPPSLC